MVGKQFRRKTTEHRKRQGHLNSDLARDDIGFGWVQVQLLTAQRGVASKQECFIEFSLRLFTTYFKERKEERKKKSQQHKAILGGEMDVWKGLSWMGRDGLFRM